MATKIFVNLPVKDLERTKAFFGALGYTFNPKFTNQNAASLVISENIHVMLLVESFFKTFIKTDIADAAKTTEVINAISLESREAVDEMIDKALAAGGTEPRESQDHGFMYVRAMQDLDGHIWEFFWMDENAVAEEAK